MITNDELDRLEALDKAATPGPWLPGEDGDGYQVVTNATGEIKIAMEPMGYSEASGSWSTYWGKDVEADFRLLAAARTALPALIAEVRSLRQAVQWMARGNLSDPVAYAKSVARAHGIPVPVQEEDADD